MLSHDHVYLSGLAERRESQSPPHAAHAQAQAQAAASLAALMDGKTMHPAPSLGEAPPKRSPTEDTSRDRLHSSSHSPSASPPARKDTNSSISTTITTASGASNLSTGTADSSYSADSAASSSPSLHQGIFSLKDGADVSGNRRASRRRTGPLSAQQREKAALIRKLGACHDCRRRRVACHPSHHNMTWEDAVRKYHRPDSPTHVDRVASGSGRPISPAPPPPPAMSHGHPHHMRPILTHDPDVMDLDAPGAPPAPAPSRLPLSEARTLRTPLPSGPARVALPGDKPVPQPLPGIDSMKTPDLQGSLPRMFDRPHRNRYVEVHAVILYWQDDEDATRIDGAIADLTDVLRQYRYTFRTQAIPPPSDECRNASRAVSREMNRFVDSDDRRDVLKIVYYIGHTCLDDNRDMVLASSRNRDRAHTIRWSGIQQTLEDAVSDVLIVMDAAYFPSSSIKRQHGVLELIAASASEEQHHEASSSYSFTHALAEQLRARATRDNALSAAELHSILLSSYPKMLRDRSPERIASPLHMQITGKLKLPSILLSPLQGSRSNSLPGLGAISSWRDVHLVVKVDDTVNQEAWEEWFRLRPEGIKDVRLEGALPRPLR